MSGANGRRTRRCGRRASRTVYRGMRALRPARHLNWVGLATEDTVMRADRQTILVGAAFVSLAWLGVGTSTSPGRALTPDDKDDKSPQKKNVLIIGASSLISPLGQPQVLGAMLASKETPMHVEGKFFGTEDVKKMLSSRKAWDYVIMDAWQFKRGGTDAPGLPDAV